MSLQAPHEKIDSCLTDRQEFTVPKVDKCMDKPVECSKLAAVCVGGLLLLGGYGELAGTLSCQSKLLLTVKSFPISCMTFCESKLICEYSSYANAEFLADQT